MLILAVLLLTVALASSIPLGPMVLKSGFLAFTYWALSWLGQSLSLLLALSSLFLLVVSLLLDDQHLLSQLILVFSGVLFLFIHNRQHLDGLRIQAIATQHSVTKAPPLDVPYLTGLWPFGVKNSRVKKTANLPYGDQGEAQLLDLYLPEKPADSPMPILIQIHGGAWIYGRKGVQSLPLVYHMASKGWMVIDINYRLGPEWRFPTMVSDVLQCIAWVRENAAQFGGDPDFIALTGGSAGGHLCALAALAANNPALQTGFEDKDTKVSAAVPFYGRYDFLDTSQVWGDNKVLYMDFMATKVMPCYPDEDSKLWELASPVAQIKQNAPPFFILHGAHDSLIPVAEGKYFYETLHKVSSNDVLYAHLSGAQHAFDYLVTPLTKRMVFGVEAFLDTHYKNYLQETKQDTKETST